MVLPRIQSPKGTSTMTFTGACRHRVVKGIVVIALLCTTLTGCGDERSAESFCSTMAKHKDRYLKAMDEVNANDNPLAGLAGMVSALGDLSQMWSELAKVAPEEIQVDVEAVAKAWDEQFETAKEVADDPLKGIASGLLSSLKVAGPMKRVGEYTEKNCPDVGSPF